MPTNDRSGLKAAFTSFNKSTSDSEAEVKLLGRMVQNKVSELERPEVLAESYQVATTKQSAGLLPKPLLQREPVRQLSFRCPTSIASELRRKAAFNQLEQQEIIVEGLKRVLLELPDPPMGWEG